MFIHIGNNNVIRTSSIIAIIDYNLFTSSADTESMLEAEDKNNKVIKIKQTPKSVIITSDLTYHTSLSVLTLQKRSGFDSMIKKVDNFITEN